MSSIPGKVLILCIDRDNDVGERLGVPTPVIGRDNLLKVAIQYILRYPDDSDANAMFAAIQLYDNLVITLGKENVEVALVTGSSSEDIMADLKLLSEVDKVLSQFNADSIIVVSDGPADESVVPLLQSKRPVISIKRVVVRQSKGFEEFAVLMKHYIAKLVVEPRYRKYALGLPGSILLLYGLFSIISAYMPSIVAVVVGAIIAMLAGIAALLYAFNVHSEILRFIRKYELTFFTIVISTVLMILYPLVNAYILKLNIQSLFLKRPTIFDVMSIVIAISLLTNIIEVYAKKGIIDSRKIVLTVAVSLFPTIILNSAMWFVMGLEPFTEFVTCIIAYVVVNILTLLVVTKTVRRIRI